MSDFLARITATLDSSAAEKELQNLTKDREVNIKVNLTGDLDGADLSKLLSRQMSGLQTTAAAAGKNVTKTFVKNMESTINRANIGGAYRKLNKVQDALNAKTIDSRIKSIESRSSNYSNGTAEYKQVENSLKEVRTAYEQVRAARLAYEASGTDSDTDKLVNEYEKLTSVLKRTESEMRILASTQDRTLGVGVGVTKSNEVLNYLNNNTKAAKKYGDQLRQLANSYKTISTVSQKLDLDADFNKLKSKISMEGLTGKSWAQEALRGFKQIGQFAATYGIIQNVIQEIPRQMVSAVYEVDTAMTSLYKVTDETAARYDKFMTDAGEKAKDLGRSISSYIEQTAEWSKLGYSLNQAEELSKVSSIYANVGEVDDATAVSDIVTTMKAFNIEATNAIDIIDQLNILGNRFATSSSDLGEGLSKSASALNTAGTDLNHTLAMLTGGAEITQSAGEFGNFLKVASMRIRGRLLCLHIRKVYMQCYA